MKAFKKLMKKFNFSKKKIGEAFAFIRVQGEEYQMKLYNEIKKDLFWFLIILIMLSYLSDYYKIGFDDSDNNITHERSNLKIYTDHLTGVQYIKFGMFGPVINRLDKYGNQVIYKGEEQMNKELIKKYKDEFDWWLDGGKVLILVDTKWHKYSCLIWKFCYK